MHKPNTRINLTPIVITYNVLCTVDIQYKCYKLKLNVAPVLYIYTIYL